MLCLGDQKAAALFLSRLKEMAEAAQPCSTSHLSEQRYAQSHHFPIAPSGKQHVVAYGHRWGFPDPHSLVLLQGFSALLGSDGACEALAEIIHNLERGL